MKVEKKDLAKSQIELTVELSVDEFRQYIAKGAKKVSQEVKIDGFRPGKIPYNVLKQKIGEMTILEEASRIAINKTIDKIIKENVVGQPVGQPKVDITKLAPDNPMEYKVVLVILPEIKLSDYKNVKVKLEKIEVKEEEADKAIKQLQEMRAKETISDKAVKDGDKAIVNIEMFLDNVPIDGGQSKDTAVIIGKGYLVPGFGKKLIGAKKGDVREFKLPYPEDHYQKNLAGKLVEFRVKIKDVYNRELPGLNDEMAKSMSMKNFEELKKNIRKNIEAEKKQSVEQKTEIKMLDKIMEKTKFGDIPEMLIDHEVKSMLHELEHIIKSQGGKFDDYLSSIKKTRDQLTLSMLPDAVKRVKSSLIIRGIAVEEKIKVEPKEIDEEVERLIKQYKGYEKVEERVNDPGYKMYIQNTIVNRKVIGKLKEWNLEK